MIEVLGIIAACFELTAIFLVGRKNKLGFISGMIGNVLWITFVTISGTTFGLYIVSPTAFILNIIGYRNWCKNGREKNTIH